MIYRLVFASSVLLMLTTLSCTKQMAKTTLLANQADAASLAKETEYLTQLLLPPDGTPRKETDHVYGHPSIYHCEPANNLSGKPCREFPPDTYAASYLLLGAKSEPNARVILNVKYVNDKAMSASFKHTRIPSQMLIAPNQSLTNSVDLKRASTRIKYEDLLILYRRYGQRINKQGWWHGRNREE